MPGSGDFFIAFFVLVFILLAPIATGVKDGGNLPTQNQHGVSGSGPLLPLPGPQGPKCQEITIPMCKGIGYNHTEMPNPFNHDSQEEAGMEVHQYWPLVEIKCSPDLRLFLCSLYVPICMEDYKGSVPPCRSLCERARYGCEPVMVQYGFQWPERMKCDGFLKFGKNNVCMDEKNGEMPPASPPIDISKNSLPGTKMGGGGKPRQHKGDIFLNQIPHSHAPFEPKCECGCKSPLIELSSSHVYFNRSNSLVVTGTVVNCALPCRGGYDSEEEIKFSNWWLLLWSGLCCFTTFVTLLTFFIDPTRFKYPERPIVYLSACYFMVSLGYLIRLYKGHEAIACKDDVIRYGIETGVTSAWCTFVFLFIYYFGMSSSIWWVVLSLTWYLAAGLKWGSEAIASHAHLFHIVAWVLPALGTFIAIADGAVDGDAISGICLIGNQDAIRLLIYIVFPLGVLLILGTSFLLAGFISLVRIRQVIARQAGRSKTEKLEKFMIRIGVFSVLYTLPASAVIGAYCYEMSSKHLWLQGNNCSCKPVIHKPLYSILMLKYFMSLAVGITSGVWIWSGKTVESWQRFLNRICCRKPPPPSVNKYTTTGFHHPQANSKNLTHV